MNIESKTDNLINKKAFYTPDDLAAIFSISKPTVYKLIAKRILPFYKIGGSIRFFKDDLEEYLNGTRIDPIIKYK
ncbi:MAG: helix-turn-helix domain-containing protein [Patescibacteria group bacterium]|jgi:excisionase family DNA binding protein